MGVAGTARSGGGAGRNRQTETDRRWGEREGETATSVEFPVGFQFHQRSKPFVADQVGREDGLEGDEKAAVVASEVDTEIAIPHVVTAGILAADPSNLEQV